MKMITIFVTKLVTHSFDWAYDVAMRSLRIVLKTLNDSSWKLFYRLLKSPWILPRVVDVSVPQSKIISMVLERFGQNINPKNTL